MSEAKYRRRPEYPAYLAEGIDNEAEAYNRFVERTKTLEPDPEQFEFQGQVEFDPPQKTMAIAAARMQGFRNAIDTEKPNTCESESDYDPSLDGGVLVSADGRVFREKRGSRRRCASGRETAFTSIAKNVQSQEVESVERESGIDLLEALPSANVPASAAGAANTIGVAPDPALDVLGGDGRQLVTSSRYPWRAVGVALFQPGSFFIRGSGCMIGPRHVLTAAHVINGNGSLSSLIPVVAAPGARGDGYSGNRWPFGRRWVQWYYWPNGWDGGTGLSDTRYDYALLILDDINWSPGWVRFGYQRTTWLDFKNFNTAGYPGNNFQCSASPLGTGSCGAYMYRQYEKVRSVLPGYFYHRFDTQEGQSGSPVYWYNGSTRIVYGIHSGSASINNLACRIRSGNFDSLCSWISNWPSSYFSNVTC